MSWPAATLVVGARVAYGSPMRCAASADAWAGWLVCERPDDAPRRPRLHRGPPPCVRRPTGSSRWRRVGSEARRASPSRSATRAAVAA